MVEFSYVLNRYPVAFQRAEIEPLGAAGGMSGARLWGITGSQGLHVLRRWPSEHPPADQLQFIHDVLRHAARKGALFLPLPVATTDGRTFVAHGGHLWQLEPWLPGAANFHDSPSPAKLQNAMRALARFHQATSDCDLRLGHQGKSIANTLTARMLPCPGMIRRLKRLGELQSGGTDTLKHAIVAADWPELARAAHSFVELLPSAVPLAIGLLAPLSDVQFALQPCLRDVWYDHVLFVGDDVTGLIDFGAMAIDAPAVDVARLLGSLAVDDAAAWQRGLKAYAAIRPLTPDEVRAVAALDASGTVLAGCNWNRWVYMENRQFDDRQQVVQRFELLLERLRQLVRRNAPIPL